MTTTAPPPCGHRWPFDPPSNPMNLVSGHRCGQPSGHRAPCRCHCGATTREDQPSGWIGTDTIRNPRLPTTREDN